MLKTLAAIVLSFGIAACLDAPSDEADPQPDNAGDTTPASVGDHQDPDTLGQEDLRSWDDEDPSAGAQPGVVGCTPDTNEDSAGPHFKDIVNDTNQCRPLG
jgi:hypothetical protein